MYWFIKKKVDVQVNASQVRNGLNCSCNPRWLTHLTSLYPSGPELSVSMSILECSDKPSEKINPMFLWTSVAENFWFFPIQLQETLFLPSWVENRVTGMHWKALGVLWWNISFSALEILDLSSMRSMSFLWEGLSWTSDEGTWNCIRQLWKYSV